MSAEKCFFVAGEASGDAHAAEVIRELHGLSSGIEIHGYGGRRMEEAGARLHYPLAEMASVGLDWVWKVFEYRRLGLRILEICREHGIRTLVLVDFPGFNLRVATAAKRAGLQVVYYIVPQVWAWRSGRLRRMKRDLDLALVIFPFEETLLSGHGIPTEFVGHPLVSQIGQPRPRAEILKEADLPVSDASGLVGLLPGSRSREVERLGPVLRDAAEILLDSHSSLHFVVPRAQTIDAGLLRDAFGQDLPWTLVENPARDLRSVFRMSITKSGTSTLENALLGVPQVIVYKGRPLDAWIARRVIRVPWLGLVNILAGEEICPEFLQDDCVGARIASASVALIEDTPQREDMLRNLENVARSLGKGDAAKNAARAILERVVS